LDGRQIHLIPPHIAVRISKQTINTLNIKKEDELEENKVEI
jgi:hypothetical protein